MSFFSVSDILSGAQPYWVRSSSIGDPAPLKAVSSAMKGVRSAIRAFNASGKASQFLSRKEAMIREALAMTSGRHTLGRIQASILSDLLQGALEDSAYYIQHTNMQSQLDRLGVVPYLRPEEVEQFMHNPGGSHSNRVIVTSRPDQHGSAEYYRGQRITIEEARAAQERGIPLSFRVTGSQFLFTRDFYQSTSGDETAFLYRNLPDAREYDGFQVWVEDILRAFDDPGDAQRPNYGPGEKLGGVLLTTESLNPQELVWRLSQIISLFQMTPRWGDAYGLDMDGVIPEFDRWVIVVEQGDSPYREGAWLGEEEAEPFVENQGMVVRRPTARDRVMTDASLLGRMFSLPGQRAQYPPSMGDLPDFLRLSGADLIPRLGNCGADLRTLASVMGTPPAQFGGFKNLSDEVQRLERELLARVNSIIEAIDSLSRFLNVGGVSRLWIPVQNDGVRGLKAAIRSADQTRKDAQRVVNPGPTDYQVGDLIPYDLALRTVRSVGQGFDFRPAENVLVAGVGIFFHPGPLARLLEALFKPSSRDVGEALGDPPSIHVVDESVEPVVVSSGGSEGDSVSEGSSDFPSRTSGAQVDPPEGATETGFLSGSEDTSAPAGSVSWGSTPEPGLRTERLGPAVSYLRDRRVLTFVGENTLPELQGPGVEEGVPLLSTPCRIQASTFRPLPREIEWLPVQDLDDPESTAEACLPPAQKWLPFQGVQVPNLIIPPEVFEAEIVPPGNRLIALGIGDWCQDVVLEFGTFPFLVVRLPSGKIVYATYESRIDADEIEIDLTLPAFPSPAGPASLSDTVSVLGVGGLAPSVRTRVLQDDEATAEVLTAYRSGGIPDPGSVALLQISRQLFHDSGSAKVIPEAALDITDGALDPPLPAGEELEAAYVSPSRPLYGPLDDLDGLGPADTLSRLEDQSVFVHSREDSAPFPDEIADRGRRLRFGWKLLTAYRADTQILGLGLASTTPIQIPPNLQPRYLVFQDAADPLLWERVELSGDFAVQFPQWEFRLSAAAETEYGGRPWGLVVSETQDPEVRLFPWMPLAPFSTPFFQNDLALLAAHHVSGISVSEGAANVGETSLMSTTNIYGTTLGVPAPGLNDVSDTPLHARSRTLTIRFIPAASWSALPPGLYTLWQTATHRALVELDGALARVRLAYRPAGGDEFQWVTGMSTHWFFVQEGVEHSVSCTLRPVVTLAIIVVRRGDDVIASAVSSSADPQELSIDGFGPPDATIRVGQDVTTSSRWRNAAVSPTEIEVSIGGDITPLKTGTPPMGLLGIDVLQQDEEAP